MKEDKIPPLKSTSAYPRPFFGLISCDTAKIDTNLLVRPLNQARTIENIRPHRRRCLKVWFIQPRNGCVYCISRSNHRQ